MMSLAVLLYCIHSLRIPRNNICPSIQTLKWLRTLHAPQFQGLSGFCDLVILCREDIPERACYRQANIMAPSTQYVFIDGNFADLALEISQYLNVAEEVQPLIDNNQKDEALKKIVTASVALNSSPEKEFTAAYNLLIYLVLQSPSVNMFLPRICDNLSKPITSSPIHSTGLALNALSTIFNLLPSDNEVRFNVFQAILRLVKTSGSFELLKPQLNKLDSWLVEWDVDEEDQRKLFAQIADVAEDAGEEE
jgi:translation initiation factor 3 subunit M